MLNIITVPNPNLRLVSKRVNLLDNNIVQYINDLGEKLVKHADPPGVGLSAIQTNNPVRILLTYLPSVSDPQPPKSERGSQLTVFINPVITNHSKTVTLGPNPKRPILEGCLSIPSLYAPVYRYDWVDVEYESPLPTVNRPLSTEPHTLRLTGFSARVFQHEFDHLDGILFTDYVVGHSPAKNFNPLGPSDRLYFDNGDTLVPIAKPSALITW
jgi:peptide deformylase